MSEVTIERLQLEIGSSSASVVSELEKLKTTMTSLKSVCKGGCGLESVVKGLNGVKDALNGLDNGAAGKLSSLATALSRLSSVSKFNLPANLSNRLTDLGAAIELLPHNFSEKLHDLSTGLGWLQGAQSMTLPTNLGKTLQEIGEAAILMPDDTFSKLLNVGMGLSYLKNIGNASVPKGLGKELTQLAPAIAALPDDTVAKLSSVAAGLQALNGAGAVTLPKNLGKNLLDMANALSQMQGQDFHVLTELGNSLAGLNGLKVSSTIATQLQKIADVAQNLNGMNFDGFTNLSNALAPLVQQLATMSGTLPTVTQNMQQLSNATRAYTTANQSASRSTTDILARFVAYGHTVARVGKAIAELVNKANSFVEDFNLFNASMGDFADKGAEFAQKVGNLMGIDPAKWMRNQGVFQTLATGFGIAADRAQIMSQNLVQLGYDLSSFFNIATDGEGGSMQKLQAGLSGELEPLRRLGFDLSQTRLEAVALSLGIKKTFADMNQAEKAQLRYYAIMTQVTTAQGDMARTLDTPANQLRILKAQVEQASRAIGSIFIPILNAILPYAIAAANAVRLIAEAIAELFGYKLPEIDYSSITSNVSSVADSMDDVATNTGTAYGNAKKLKELLADWDELNIIQSESEKTGGSNGGGKIPNVTPVDNWAWELPTYDFLAGLTESRASKVLEAWKPTIQYIKDNLGNIMSLVGSIGAGILAWDLTRKLVPSIQDSIGWLDQLLTGVLGIALAAGTVALNMYFTMSYLETGNIGDLIGGAITTVAGASLVGKIIRSAFTDEKVGAIAGKISTGLVFAINGLVDFTLGLRNMKGEGFTKENVLTMIKGAIGMGVGGSALVIGIFEALFGKLTFRNNAGLAAATIGAVANVTLNLALMEGGLAKGSEGVKEILESLGTNAVSAAEIGTAVAVGFKDAKSGFVATGITFLADAVMDVTLAMGKVTAEDGLDAASLTALAKAALEGAVGAGLLASFGLTGGFDLATAAKGAAAGFTALATVGVSIWLMDKSSDAESDAATVGYGAAAVVESALGAALTGLQVSKLADDPKWGWRVAGITLAINAGITAVELFNDMQANGGKMDANTWTKAITSAMEFAAAGMAIGMTFGHPVAGALLGAAIGIAVTAGIAIWNILNAKKKLSTLEWGPVSATGEEIETYVKENFFTRTVSAEIEVGKTAISNLSEARTRLNAQIGLASLTLKKLVIRSTIDAGDEQLNTLKEQLTGEDGLITKLQSTLKESGEMISVGVGLIWGNGTEGSTFGADLLADVSNADSLINQTATNLGDEIARLIGEGYSDGLDKQKTEMLFKLTSMLTEITTAVAQGQASAKFALGVQGVLDLDQGSFEGVLDSYIKQRDQLRTDLEQIYDQTAIETKGRAMALQKSMEAELLLNGNDKTASGYVELEQQYNKLMADYKAMIDNRAKYIDSALAIYGAEGNQILKEAFMTRFDKDWAAENTIGRGGYAFDNMENFLKAVVHNVVGDSDFAILSKALDAGVLSIADLFTDEQVQSLVHTVFGFESNIDQALLSQWENLKTPAMTITPPDTSGAAEAITGLAQTVQDSVTGIRGALDSINGTKITFFTGVDMPGKFTPTAVGMAAAGGMFDEGEFFVAREAGPELVGTIGRRTAVANNEQIEGGIASGVREANSEQNALLSESNRYLRAIAQKSNRFTLEPSTALARTVKRSEEMRLVSEGV